MYFNIGREKKQQLLDFYRKEALDSRRKKEEAKKLKIQEELNYLHKKEQEEVETEQKLIQEKATKRKALMEEYLQMLKKTKNDIPGYHYIRKNKDVIINNWGKSKEECLLENNTNLFGDNKNKSRNVNKSVDDKFSSLSQIEKARQIIKPVDSMNQFLTDEQNLNEVNLLFLRRKNNKRDFYRNLLFSQHEESNKLNKDKYGTEDILILKQKKKNLISDNPYRKKYKYNFGNSSLENNPILNPKNNIKYNRYFKDFYQDTIKQEIDNIVNENDRYKNNNNFTIERTHNNMAINGSNIIKNFSVNKNPDDKNDKLYRNFSGIIKEDSPKKEIISMKYTNYDQDKNIDKVMSNRSMSLKNF